MELDRLIPGSDYFKWREFLWLNKWKIHCFPTPQQEVNLIRMASTMKRIREYFNRPIIVTSGLRPAAYNKFIKGAKYSSHRFGMACDFYLKSHTDGDDCDFIVKTYSSDNGCDYIRKQLVPLLDDLKIRMEDNPRSNWIHVDLKDPTENGRYFKP